MTINTGGEDVGAIDATIIPFPSQQAQSTAQAQRRALSILREMPKRYRKPWVRMGERMVNGMPTEEAKALCVQAEQVIAEL